MKNFKLKGIGNLLAAIVLGAGSVFGFKKYNKSYTKKHRVLYGTLTGVGALVSLLNLKEAADKMFLPVNTELEEEDDVEDEFFDEDID